MVEFSKPSIGVGQGPHFQMMKIGANATAAKCLPGIAVVKDTNDYSVKEGSASVIGTLGWERTPLPWKPANRDTAYARGDSVAVEMGPRMARMLLTTSQTIVKGDPLYVTTDGYVAKATVGTHDVYGEALESVSTTAATTAIWVMTRR